jgi:ABC-type transport system involved in multi-copper enzyme maturation permease subunit
MIQAVFHFEMLQAGRRRRGFFLRWLYAGFLLVQIAPLFFQSNFAWARLLTGFNVYAFFEGFLVQHYVLLTLLTPAMVGGAITDEKTRGTLQHLLTAGARAGEIILGKMLAQTYQLVLLALVGLPLFCFFAGLAGDVTFPLTVMVTSLALVFAVAAVSILFSVWCRTTRDALLCIYVLMGMAVLVVPFLAATPSGAWLPMLNPLRVLSLDDLSVRWAHLGPFLLSWLSLGSICVLMASWRLRHAARRQLSGPRRGKARWWHGDHGRVRGNPVLWREQRVEGIAPLEFLRRLPRWLGVLAVMAASAAALAYSLVRMLRPADNAGEMIRDGAWIKLYDAFVGVSGDAFFWQGLAALLVLTFVVAIRASGAITGEKEKGTWLPLLLTPLTSQKIITGKHWGIFWACVPYVAAHAVVAVPAALFMGFEAVTWSLLWIGVMLLSVILGGAVGLWCSARAASSWRSLLSALAVFYLGWLLFFVPVTFILVIVRGVIELVLHFIGVFEDTSIPLAVVSSVDIRSWALCFGLAAAFWFVTQRLLAAAVRAIGRRPDRTMEMEFDYYYLYRENYRRKQEEKWVAPRVDYIEEMETTPVAVDERDDSPIPMN